MQDFINDIKPAMAACGLRFPSPEQMGIEMPEGIDLTLPETA
jgi:hypothetical protein